MTITLQDNELKVKDEQGKTYNVEAHQVRSDFMLEITVNLFSDSREGDIFTVDVLNETVPQALEDAGFTVLQ